MAGGFPNKLEEFFRKRLQNKAIFYWEKRLAIVHIFFEKRHGWKKKTRRPPDEKGKVLIYQNDLYNS